MSAWLLPLAVPVCTVIGALAMAWGASTLGRGFLDRRDTAQDRAEGMAHHPAVRMTGPVPRDGKPLSDREQRALAAVEMDAMIRVPEPRYPQSREERRDG